MRPASRSAAGIGTVAGLLACASGPTESEAPYLRGTLAAVNASGQLLVVDSTRSAASCARGLPGLRDDTVVEDARGQSLARTELRVGALVAVWTDGPVAESCPPIFAATRVAVLRPAP